MQRVKKKRKINSLLWPVQSLPTPFLAAWQLRVCKYHWIEKEEKEESDRFPEKIIYSQCCHICSSISSYQKNIEQKRPFGEAKKAKTTFPKPSGFAKHLWHVAPQKLFIFVVILCQKIVANSPDVRIRRRVLIEIPYVCVCVFGEFLTSQGDNTPFDTHTHTRKHS